MEIYINDEKLDFTLENEQNLGQIVESLESWLQKSGLIITSIRKDNAECINEKRGEWENSPLPGIERLSIGVKTAKELHVSTCENILTFLTLLRRGIEQADRALIDELLIGFPFVVESLKLLFNNNSFPMGTELSEFESLEKELCHDEIPQGSIAEHCALLDAIQEKVSALFSELRYPLESLRQVASELKSSIGEISDVSILLQTGKDKKAFDSIIHFSEHFQSLLRIFTYIKTEEHLDLSAYVIGDSNLENYYNKLNATLKELHDAFTINDFVLIGDLLEYEIAPKITELIQFIENFKDPTRSGK